MFYNEITNLPTIKEWVNSYMNGDFNVEKNLHTIKECNWFSWANENNLADYMPEIFNVINAISKTKKFAGEEDFFVTLKEVTTYSYPSTDYANIIISQKTNNTPIFIITPDYTGKNEKVQLFVISNKDKKVDSVENICLFIDEEIK